MRQDKLLSLSFAAIMFAGGLYCLLAPGLAIETIAMITGLGLIFYGLGHLFVWMSRLGLGISDYWLLACSIIALIGGAVLWGSGMAHKAFELMLVYVFSAWLIICGLLSIMHALGLRKMHVTYNTKTLGTHWPLLAGAGILLGAAGVFFIFAPQAALGGFAVMLGAGLIVGALASVANVFAE